MKTVMYRDIHGAIRVEEYDEYFHNYQAGLVPPQKIDVYGVLIESSKLYDVMLKAATNAANKEEEEKEKRYAERFYKLTCGRLIVYINAILANSFIFYREIKPDDPEPILNIGSEIKPDDPDPILSIGSAFIVIICVYLFFRDLLAYRRHKKNNP